MNTRRLPADMQTNSCMGASPYRGPPEDDPAGAAREHRPGLDRSRFASLGVPERCEQSGPSGHARAKLSFATVVGCGSSMHALWSEHKIDLCEPLGQALLAVESPGRLTPFPSIRWSP